MKFGDIFESHLTAEWREQYIRYKYLKALIHSSFKNTPTDRRDIEDYQMEFQRMFFAICDQELSRVDNFFCQKMAEARRKLQALEDELNANANNSPRSKKSNQLGFACREFYLSLIMLQNFQSLNYTGFVKICQKYDKYFKSTYGAAWFKQNVRPAALAEENELKNALVKVEELYINFLANGDRAKAMSKLRVPPLPRHVSSSQVFLAGVILGLFIVSASIVIISLIYYRSHKELIATIIRLYRGPTAFVLYVFYLAVNVHVWQNMGINHVLIFGGNLRKRVPATTFLQVASGLGLICALSMILFIHHNEFEVQEKFHFPSACLVVPLSLLLFPLPIFNASVRLWLIRTTGHILGAPFFKVDFPDFWIADQLTSMVLCITDHYHLIRFYIGFYGYDSKSLDFAPDYFVLLIRILAPWFRMAQCLRRYHDTNLTSRGYLFNALKYGASIITVLFSFLVMQTNYKYETIYDNPWMWTYLLSAMISSIYSTTWDFKYDFGLFKITNGENIFLREHLVYPRSFYYFVIGTNVFIRFIWTLELFLVYNEYISPYYCKTIVGIAEITRRFLWNFIRLENEHLNNCGEFRATRDIYLETIARISEERLKQP